MLNTMSPADAASARTRTGVGAALLCASPATPRDRAAETAAARRTAAAPVVATARPRVSSEAVFVGTSAHATAQAVSAKQPTSQKYAHVTTRIAAFGGGALGPHPARDPV